MATRGKVYLVGAGPGDPGLITVKGLDMLRRADVVVHDYLANPRLLAETKKNCELIFVGKRHDIHLLEQDKINQILVEKALAGKTVVRLKGGDPFIFGRGGEEAEALAGAGVPFEVVPGVTSAIAVPAYAGIPLTHRDFSSDVAFITGHETEAKTVSGLDWDKLARGIGTLVFLMGVKNLSNITASLIGHGRRAQTPVAVIRWGTLAEQRVVLGTLADIAVKVKEAGLRPPAVTVVGEVVRLREKLAWFEDKPLFGRRILITRPREQSRELIRALEDAGAETVEFPTIQTVPVNDYSLLDQAVKELSSYDWIIFTSANGVSYFMDRLKLAGKDVRELKDVKIAAVGPATARRVETLNIAVDLIPINYIAEGLLEEFRRICIAGNRLLLPRAKSAREVLPQQLREMGAEVTVAPAYETVTATTNAAPVRRQIEDGKIDWITFTSASTVENFAKLINGDLEKLLEKVKVAAIGPVTAGAAVKRGIKVDSTAAISTNEGLVEAIIKGPFKK